MYQMQSLFCKFLKKILKIYLRLAKITLLLNKYDPTYTFNIYKFTAYHRRLQGKWLSEFTLPRKIPVIARN